MDQIDIDRGANLLIDQYGDDAEIHAAMRVDALMEAGDVDGVAAWKRIMRAIEALQGTGAGTRH